MRIMHICNNYISSLVHKNIIEYLAKKPQVEKQYVFIPIRNSNHYNKNKIENHEIIFDYTHCIIPFMKYFPLLKILIVSFIFFIKNYKTKFDHIIAHNLWSDGLIALIFNIYKKVPYTLVVRNTDMNIFLPKLPHYRFIFYILIKNSKNLVFISKAYEQEFREFYPKLYNASSHKVVIWNGVDKFWLDNRDFSNSYRDLSICYVGRFTKSKNLVTIYNALKALKNNVEFKIIGDDIELLYKYLGINTLPTWIKYYEKTNDKEKLKKIYRSSRVLVMPSIAETFGLTYIEALTQGCGVIHSKGQGIDGIFHEDFIIGVNSSNEVEIQKAIVYLTQNYANGIPIDFINKLDSQFNWDAISSKYLEIIS